MVRPAPRIDDLDRQLADLALPDRVEIDRCRVDDAILVDRRGPGIDRLGHLLRRRPAVGDIVFDAEIFVRPAGIVAGGQDEAADRAALADQVGCSGGRKDAPLPHDHAAKAVRRRHADRDADHLAVEEAAIATDHQCGALFAVHHVEYRLDEVFGIMGLLKDFHLLAEPGCARLLIGKGGGRHRIGHALINPR
jgi:hypothetical protein